MKSRAPVAGLFLLGILLTLIVYLPALDAGFYFDDRPNILIPPGIHWTSFSLANMKKLFSSSSTLITPRFAANFTFALNHLFGGLEPRGYHLVNVLIHLAVGVALAWLIVLIITETSGPESHSPSDPGVLLAAGVATTLFLVHPLNIQAVTYVVQRMASMATLFSLLSFSCYLLGRRNLSRGTARLWFILSGFSWILALGSKEIALALPLLLLTYEGCFHRAYWRERLGLLIKGGWRTTLILLFASIFVLSLGAILLKAYVRWFPFSLTQQFHNRDFNGLERVLTQSRVQLFYLTLLVWPAPSRLNLDHDFLVSRSLLEPPSTLFAVLFWAAAAVGTILLAWKRPRFGFPLLAYLELHLIESGPINLEIVFEHRMYLPMAALAVLVATVLADLPTRRRRVWVALALACAPPLAKATYMRNVTWADPIAFHYDTAQKSSNKSRPQHMLGTILAKRGLISEAIPHLERAVALDPENSKTHNQLANVLLLAGRPQDALIEYQTAVRLEPDYIMAVYKLAKLLDQLGYHKEAITYYRRFVSIAPPWLAQYVAKVKRRILYLHDQAPHGLASGQE